jgi:hypothetical protein
MTATGRAPTVTREYASTTEFASTTVVVGRAQLGEEK